jgi:hypothetical protein
MRLCKDCNTEFTQGAKKRHCCRSCHNLRVKVSKYKISREKIIELLYKEDCDLCGKYMKTKNIDHCHKTGIVRGVLCTNCNTALGKLKDDIDLFRKAIKYLKTTETL